MPRKTRTISLLHLHGPTFVGKLSQKAAWKLAFADHTSSRSRANHFSSTSANWAHHLPAVTIEIMKAWTLKTPANDDTRPLELLDTPIPVPRADELLVRVSACGVCRTD